MKREEMNRIIREDLKHLPRSTSLSITQNMLRSHYSSLRRHHLSKGETTKEQTLIECIEYLQRNEPSFQPSYDRGYFKI